MLTTLKIEPVRERVQAEIRKNIFSGAFPPGSELNLDVLAEQLDCSRMPIREALQLLEGEGLVDYIPKQGVYVKEISTDFIDDYFDTKNWLVGIAIERACQAGIDETLLTQYLEEETAAYERYDFKALSACNQQLEEYVYKASKSPLLETYLLQLWKVGPRHYSKSGETQNRFVEATFHFHQKFISALIARDVTLAKKLHYEHQEITKTTYFQSRFEEGNTKK